MDLNSLNMKSFEFIPLNILIKSNHSIYITCNLDIMTFYFSIFCGLSDEMYQKLFGVYIFRVEGGKRKTMGIIIKVMN